MSELEKNNTSEIEKSEAKASKSTIVDMTSGSEFKHIVNFALPMLIGYVFQQFYSMVDTIIVGKILGVHALAGVGSTSAINFMIIGFCTGICAGFSIPISQSFGAKRFHSMRKFIANSIWLGVIFSVLITLPVCALTGTILHAMNTSADIYDFAYDYIFIVFAGIPATILYNLSSSIIRSFGDSKTPLYFLLLSSLLNIVLDLVTIINFGMGVAGAAYATVFSQLVSGVLCSVYMYKHFQIVHCNKNELRPSPSYLKRLTIMGVPMGLQYTITAVGSVILQTAVNGLGYVSIAAITAGNKVRTFFSTPYDSLGGTMATFAGQNVGARKFDRIKSGLFAASKIGFAYMLISLLVMVFFGRQLALLFVSAEDTEIIEFTRFYLVVDASFGMLLSCVNVFRFTMQGMGFSGPAMFAGIMEMIGRSLAAFMLVPIYGFKGACFAGAIAWFFADLFLIPGCFAFINKLKRQAGLI